MPFSYTDDAIVSSSPTGRHLSTVIKRPCVLMSGWDQHAEAVCKVLNDLQPDHPVRNLTARVGVNPGALRRAADQLDRAALERKLQILGGELDEATTKLCAAQMLLEQPVEVSTEMAHILYHAAPGSTHPANNATRTIKKV